MSICIKYNLSDEYQEYSSFNEIKNYNDVVWLDCQDNQLII